MTLAHLKALETESIHIFREVAATFQRPVMLYSGDKDSSVLQRLALKAFFPSKPPFPLLDVETGWEFRDMIAFRNATAKRLGLERLVHINEEGRARGISPFDQPALHTEVMKTEALQQALDTHGFDAVIGDVGRDGGHVFSSHPAARSPDSKARRPQFWQLYNGRIGPGERVRVLPLSNWTETDIWHYIRTEEIPIAPLYFAAPRPVVERDGTLILVDDERMKLKDGEQPMERVVRFRTLGCYPLTGAVESSATTLDDILAEIAAARTFEPHGRTIVRDRAASATGMTVGGYR